MSKLAHSDEESMAQIERNSREREERGELNEPNDPKHTPTPYAKEQNGNGTWHVYAFLRARRVTLSDNLSEETAAFIVRAVNSHADLVGALQNFINGIQTGAIVTEYDEIMENAVIRAHDAIRKARGE